MLTNTKAEGISNKMNEEKKNFIAYCRNNTHCNNLSDDEILAIKECFNVKVNDELHIKFVVKQDIYIKASTYLDAVIKACGIDYAESVFGTREVNARKASKVTKELAKNHLLKYFKIIEVKNGGILIYQ